MGAGVAASAVSLRLVWVVTSRLQQSEHTDWVLRSKVDSVDKKLAHCCLAGGYRWSSLWMWEMLLSDIKCLTEFGFPASSTYPSMATLINAVVYHTRELPCLLACLALASFWLQ